jgi:hypothetical protein
VGLQESELEDLKRVDSRDVLHDVHHLREGLLLANQAAGSEIQKAGRVSLLGSGRTTSTAGGDCKYGK